MRRKFKRPLTFLLALLLLFSLTGASVQAEESGNAGTSNQAQTVVMQADGTQKEDDVGAAASTEENVQQEIPEISSEVLQQEIPEISSNELQHSCFLVCWLSLSCFARWIWIIPIYGRI